MSFGLLTKIKNLNKFVLCFPSSHPHSLTGTLGAAHVMNTALSEMQEEV